MLDEQWPFAYLQVYCDAVVDNDPDLVVDVMMAVAAPQRRPSQWARRNLGVGGGAGITY